MRQTTSGQGLASCLLVAAVSALIVTVSAVDISTLIQPLSAVSSPLNNIAVDVVTCGPNLYAYGQGQSFIRSINGTWQNQSIPYTWYAPPPYSMPITQIFARESILAGGIDATGAVSKQVFIMSCHDGEYDYYNYYGQPPVTPFKAGWRLLSSNSPWPARADHAILTWRGRVFVMGGFGGNEAFGNPILLNDVWSFDIKYLFADSTSWTQHATADWAPRRGFAATTHGDVVFVSSGQLSGVDNFANDVWMWTDYNLPWKQLPVAPWTARYKPIMASVNGWLVFMGGEYSPQGQPIQFLQDAYVYNGTQWISNDNPFPINPSPKLISGALTALGSQLWISSPADVSVWNSSLPTQGPTPLPYFEDAHLYVLTDLAYDDYPGTYTDTSGDVMGMTWWKGMIVIIVIILAGCTALCVGMWWCRKRAEKQDLEAAATGGSAYPVVAGNQTFTTTIGSSSAPRGAHLSDASVVRFHYLEIDSKTDSSV